MTYEGNEVI